MGQTPGLLSGLHLPVSRQGTLSPSVTEHQRWEIQGRERWVPEIPVLLRWSERSEGSEIALRRSCFIFCQYSDFGSRREAVLARNGAPSL